MNKKTFWLVMLSIVSVPHLALAWGQPESYEDCILKNMKGVESDRAAYAIKNACREMFPEKDNGVTVHSVSVPSHFNMSPKETERAIVGRWTCERIAGKDMGASYEWNVLPDFTYTVNGGENTAQWEIRKDGKLIKRVPSLVQGNFSTYIDTVVWLDVNTLERARVSYAERCTRM